MLKKISVPILSMLIICGLSACDQPLTKRNYTEIFIESEPLQTMPMDQQHQIRQMMPQDDIHANLVLDDMIMGDSDNSDLQRNLQKSVVKEPLSWTTPENWSETRGNGMRVVTFNNNDKNSPVEVTVIALGGNAGGLSANVIRWMQQINVPAPTDKALENFLNQQEKFQTDSNFQVTLINLTEWQGDTPSNSPSMIAAIIDRGNSQIFVKMTGMKDSVLKNMASLKSLVKSITANE